MSSPPVIFDGAFLASAVLAAAALAAAGTYLLVRRRGAGAAHANGAGAQGPTSAQLAADLQQLRTLIRSYIQEREAAEEKLRASEERYRALIERAAYGIFRSTPEGRFLDANPALVRMLGYDSEEELKRLHLPTDLYVDPAERERLMARLRDEHGFDWQDVRWRRRDGTVITVRLTVRVKRNAAGRIDLFEGIAEDATERSRHEELLRRSERMASLGTTLAGVAHELNNPLAAISGFSQILLRGTHSEEDRSAIETIHRESLRAARIVKDLLVFSRRQEAERHELVQVNDVVRYVVSTRRYSMETRGISCHVELAEELPPVLADPTQVEQVLLNLIVNAEQALEQVFEQSLEGPHDSAAEGEAPAALLSVRTSSVRGSVVIEVADSGPGISRENLSRIWDPFWTTKSEGEGTGLGLPVVHGIVAAHGGTIEVESAVDVGTCFTVRLPAADPAQHGDGEPAATPEAADSARAAHPLDILVVDDEPAIARFLEQYLASRGHAVLTATAGATALRMAEQMPFDVVICDLRMPGVDGFEVVRRLRALPGREPPRIVISTGASMDASARRRLETLQVAAVVPKPYDIELLRRSVEQG